MTDHHQTALPQLDGRRFVTDGGMETDLIFHHGIDLPHFAAFPLIERAEGREVLTRYYDGYAHIAREAGAGLMLESGTWRASPDWGERLGYSVGALTDVNRQAIHHLAQLRETYAEAVPEILISGMIGPRRDGYEPAAPTDPDDAAAYHRPQIEAFADAGADLATAYTLADAGEAIGIVRAARAVGLPVAISFTVETDGRLASGASLAQAIGEVDADDPPEHFLVNCSHPTHIARGLGEPGPWRERIRGLRPNASARSHAELDEADELDEGDPRALADARSRLDGALPGVSIVGGCCGTDARHVAAMWAVD
jgi:S-methylmethionine-dependent homocysteine/selenocysteine methylase